MAVFDDAAREKLVLYPHRVEWKNRVPTAVKADGEVVSLDSREPLKAECQHFLDCVGSRRPPVSNGAEGRRGLKVLHAWQGGLGSGSAEVPDEKPKQEPSYFVHESSFLDAGAHVGAGTKIWHFSHVMKGAHIGERCVIGQNVNIDGGAMLGDNVKIQ